MKDGQKDQRYYCHLFSTFRWTQPNEYVHQNMHHKDYINLYAIDVKLNDGPHYEGVDLADIGVLYFGEEEAQWNR